MANRTTLNSTDCYGRSYGEHPDCQNSHYGEQGKKIR